MLVGAAPSSAQTTGDSTAGQQLFTTTLSPQCSSCHSTTDSGGRQFADSIRNASPIARPRGRGRHHEFRQGTRGAATRRSTGTITRRRSHRHEWLLHADDRRSAVTRGLHRGTRRAGSDHQLLAHRRCDLSRHDGRCYASATVTIRNTGTAPLTFATNNAVTIATGGDAADFRIASATCNPGSTLAANSGNCTINVTFTPAAGRR